MKHTQSNHPMGVECLLMFHPTGEFIIMAKFGGHVPHHLASWFANVIRQGGRQTKTLALAIFLKIHT